MIGLYIAVGIAVVLIIGTIEQVRKRLENEAETRHKIVMDQIRWLRNGSANTRSALEAAGVITPASAGASAPSEARQ